MWFLIAPSNIQLDFIVTVNYNYFLLQNTINSKNSLHIILLSQRFILKENTWTNNDHIYGILNRGCGIHKKNCNIKIIHLDYESAWKHLTWNSELETVFQLFWSLSSQWPFGSNLAPIHFVWEFLCRLWSIFCTPLDTYTTVEI